MPESSAHTNLVNLLVKWLIKLLPLEDSSHIFVDSPDNAPHKKPPRLYEFVPDVFVSNSQCYGFIIGEAKTANDIDNTHTIEQITAFLRKCSEIDNSLFVLAVPWYQVRLAAAVIKYCKKTAGLNLVQTIVIDNLPG